MPMRENITVKLVCRKFPRYVLVHGDEFYRGPDEGWGLFLHEAFLYANLKRATRQAEFLKSLAQFDRERRESERRRLNGEEENENDK